MQILKFVLGVGCLCLGLLFALVVVSLPFRFASDFPLVICSLWIAFNSLFLVLRVKKPLARAERVGFSLSFFLPFVLLISIALPNFFKSRPTSAANACINNLRQIDAAANQFALENHKMNGEAINFPDDLTPYINSQGKIPKCPGGGIYTIKKVGDTPTCSLGTPIAPAHVLP